VVSDVLRPRLFAGRCYVRCLDFVGGRLLPGTIVVSGALSLVYSFFSCFGRIVRCSFGG